MKTQNVNMDISSDDNDEKPKIIPVKPDRENDPAIDPGDPKVDEGEKEKTKEKIPINHPGNKTYPSE